MLSCIMKINFEANHHNEYGNLDKAGNRVDIIKTILASPSGHHLIFILFNSYSKQIIMNVVNITTTTIAADSNTQCTQLLTMKENSSSHSRFSAVTRTERALFRGREDVTPGLLTADPGVPLPTEITKTQTMMKEIGFGVMISFICILKEHLQCYYSHIDVVVVILR